MDNYLVHYGVPGQKWGDRKYQYEDGTLTPEGRRHYGYGLRPDTIHKHIKESENDYRYKESNSLKEKINNRKKADSLRDEAQIITNPNAYKKSQRVKTAFGVSLPVVLAASSAGTTITNMAYLKTGNKVVSAVAGISTMLLAERTATAIAGKVSDSISDRRIKETREKYGLKK